MLPMCRVQIYIEVHEKTVQWCNVGKASLVTRMLNSTDYYDVSNTGHQQRVQRSRSAFG
jgi:hypothetical protein